MAEIGGWVTTGRAKDLTGYSLQYLRILAREGRVKAMKIGGRQWLLHRDSLIAYKRRMDMLGSAKHAIRSRGDEQETQGGKT